jgi:hypothetical protein
MASTAHRVTSHTAREVNRRIEQEMVERIAHFSEHPNEIAARLDELDREWDIERAIEANASAIALIGIGLGATGDRRWFMLPALVAAFLFQHATEGWCPPGPVLRRLGFRTADEINQERYALKAIRGDFEPVRKASGNLTTLLRAVGTA